MFLSLILACSCLWSFEDFRNEVNSQIYQISQEIESLGDEPKNLYDYAYLQGKLDVYKSLEEGMQQEIPIEDHI